MENLNEKLRFIMSEILGVDENLITEDSKLREDLGAESIDFVDLLYQIEKNFKIGKIKLDEIYLPDIETMEYSENNCEMLLQKYPYLKGEMEKCFKKAVSFDAIRTFRAIKCFLN